MLRITINEVERRRDECLRQARSAQQRGAPFFQVYLALGKVPLERWLGEDEQTRLVEALEAEDWIFDGIGYVDEPPRGSFYCGPPSQKAVAVIYTFRSACSTPTGEGLRSA